MFNFIPIRRPITHEQNFLFRLQKYHNKSLPPNMKRADLIFLERRAFFMVLVWLYIENFDIQVAAHQSRPVEY